MKCGQRLCQRNKNLKPSGYCNVCDDLIEDIKKKHETAEKKRQFGRVELDFNLLKDTHNKLLNGNKVDHDIVNVLLLGGITNILCQSVLLDTTIEKIKELETENLTVKVRLEALENWALKLNEKHEKIKEEVEESLEERIRARIDAFHEEALSTKENIPTPQTSKPCKECDETFSKNFELENHMVHVHGCQKSNSCDICGKKFYLEWRLRKHLQVHAENVKKCKYYCNGKECPFEEVGCKFKHGLGDAKDLEEVEIEETEMNDLSNVEYGENDCHLCETKLDNLEDLCEHFKFHHQVYYEQTYKLSFEAGKSSGV